MMVELEQGDILQAEADALVNTVNCVGVMGRGIALQFRKAFPQNFKSYEVACERKEVRPGRMFVHETGLLTGPRFIINFPTKRHWKEKSRIEDIDSGLRALTKEVKDRGIRSIAVPPLGCGLGGLNWNVVRPRIIRAFDELSEVRVLLFQPAGAPKADEMPDVERLVEAAQMHAKKGHNDTCSLALCGDYYQCDCGYTIAVVALARGDRPVAPKETK